MIEAVLIGIAFGLSFGLTFVGGVWLAAHLDRIVSK